MRDASSTWAKEVELARRMKPCVVKDDFDHAGVRPRRDDRPECPELPCGWIRSEIAVRRGGVFVFLERSAGNSPPPTMRHKIVVERGGTRKMRRPKPERELPVRGSRTMAQDEE